MAPLAHSARPKKGIPAQEYALHIRRVHEDAALNADKAADFSAKYGAALRKAVRLAALFHDLGKLDAANQRVLGGHTCGRLPLNHVDAGTAYLFGGAEKDVAWQLAASAVYSHHRGLPAIMEEWHKGENCFRDCDKQSDGRSLRIITDAHLSEYLEVHRTALPDVVPPDADCPPVQLTPLLMRLALSSLVDADHTDTARNYRDPVAVPGPALLPAERLEKLDTYVAGLAGGRNSEKTKLRNSVYATCRNADTTPGLVECDSPVGSGKTTAVMAHLLQAAKAKQLRRIFVVLPFTNIINQSVDTYRVCLKRDGEQPDEIVAAHHHKAEHKDILSRHFTALWHAPVVVVTAVQFFETLAGCHTAALRKLHQLPGSAIFIDESHASLPAHLWPQAWQWLKELVRDWSCHIVLGSGSLNRLWRLPEFDEETPDLPKLVETNVQKDAVAAEKQRIVYRTRPDPLEMEQLIEWVKNLPGPRLLIVNTVQSAAAIARRLGEVEGRRQVEHLSTALTPRDREKTLKRIRKRLVGKENDANWTLVATSCVEAGVDFSFRTGLRERAGLTNLIQIGGRVNRSGEYGSADVWDFQLCPVGLICQNPGYKDSIQVLAELFAEGKVEGHYAPDFCTEALCREVRTRGLADLNKKLRKAEATLDFPEVDDLFQVIEQATVTVVVDRKLQRQLEIGGRSIGENFNFSAYKSMATRWKSTEYKISPISLA
jgi:CRISPR-associated endonuclease/helicase Cas3